ncbi:hypothetical protein CS063_03040 [Sporanaerobium hydrogeniformans]|uniref:Uncharacterized protein n=1 Tax=Sporanaerobium hydrogeniformans TaxID=3072179 RepID=A0AC61DF77_9FIRM|nr:AAA family ATPase [Sporanaerobium hydrogeniformans]PHV71560.1 hypothetical protein CS063_03040 [Sporanaerobium hydrogeniformans]
MRPKYLKMTAFGPYGGEQIIDFGLLQEANMFLIHGPTGGGKTTLLDAMCYGLYGETNGGERSGESMRSKFAEPEVITEIEFIFSLRGREYKMIRRPQYDRDSKRGSGKVKVNSEVELYKLEEGEWILLSSKYNEVSEHIQTLLHFNVEQFRQVIMIAQNKFRELLTVSSKERQAILQDIFETGIYQKVEKRLERMQSAFKEQVKEKQLIYENWMNNIEPLEEEELKAYIATKFLNNAPQVAELLERQCKIKQERLKVLEEETEALSIRLKAYQQKLSELTQKYNQSIEYATIRKEWDNLNEQLPYYEESRIKIEKAEKAILLLPLGERVEELREEIKNQLESIEQTLLVQKQMEIKQEILKKEEERVKEFPKQIEKLKKEEGILESYLPKVEQLFLYKEKEKKLEQEVDKDEMDLKALLAHLEQLKKEWEEEEVRLKSKGELQRKLSESLLEQKEIERVLERKVLIAKKKQERNQLLKTYQERKKAIEEKMVYFNERLAYYNHLFEKFMLNQAGELAQNLRDNTPCPVCGSYNHPHKASLVASRITKETLEVEEKNNKKLESEMNKEREALAAVVEQGKGLKEVIEEYEKEIKGQEAFEWIHKEKLDKTIEDLKKQMAELDALEQTHQVKRERQKDQEYQKEKRNQRLEEKRLQLTQVKTHIEAIKAEIPEALTQGGNLDVKLEQIKKQVIQLETQHKEVMASLETLLREQGQNKAVQLEKIKRMEGLKIQLSEKEESFKQALEVNGLFSQEEYKRCKALIPEKEELKIALEAYKERKTLIEAQMKELETKVKNFKKEDLEAAELQQQALIKRNSELAAEAQMHTHYCITHLKIKEEVLKLYETNNTLIKKKEIIDRISLIAKGKNKKGLSFERYIQSSIFEEVLKSANKKLKPMTQNRYELYRTDDLQRANAQAGLDIGIIDYYSQQTRPVTTLSGGESFMAALALALGLAEVIERLAGATPLEAMFIDEGFGSLDEEALDQAIKTLLSIQDTGRLIGIISHVKELKEQIPIRLEITSGTTGSRAQFCL